LGKEVDYIVNKGVREDVHGSSRISNVIIEIAVPEAERYDGFLANTEASNQLLWIGDRHDSDFTNYPFTI
jgi:hypothetical protein